MDRRSRIILTVFGIIIVALALTYAILLARATVKLRRAYAALAADGRPMQAAAIVPPKVADAENAAVLYQSAVLLLKGQPAGDKSLYERLTDYHFRPKAKTELNELLRQEAVDKAVSLIEQGTRRPACRLEHDSEEILSFPSVFAVDMIGGLTSIMRAREILEGEAGHTAQVWDLLLMQLRFADSLRLDPTSATQYTRLGIAARVCRTVQGLCETDPPDPERGRALDALLQRQDDVNGLIRGMDGERLLIGERFFSLPRDELDKAISKEFGGHERHEGDAIPPTLAKALYRLGFQVVAFKPRLVADHAAYLDLMRRRVNLLQGPYRGVKEYDEVLQTSRWNILTIMLGATSHYQIYVYRRDVAHLRMTRAGLALFEYRRTHGAFPETLATLGLGDLIDPFANQPLHYRPEGEGFVLYSVGEDGKDNGGTPKPEHQDSNPRRRQKEYDEVWRFPTPKSPKGSQ
jgi:hypothetical protein